MKFKLLSLAGSLLLCAATRAADLTITDFGAVADGHAINTSIVPNIVMDQAEGPVFIRLGDRAEAYQTPSPGSLIQADAPGRNRISQTGNLLAESIQPFSPQNATSSQSSNQP